ncbi:MAG: hypothetical protein AAF570_27615 [Bacteroidota bacterium]
MLFLAASIVLSGCSLKDIAAMGKVEYVVENKSDQTIKIEALKDGLDVALEATEIPPGEKATIYETTAEDLTNISPSVHFDKINVLQSMDGEDVSVFSNLGDADWDKKFVGTNTLQLILIVN